MIIIEKERYVGSLFVYILTKDNEHIKIGQLTPLFWSEPFKCDDIRLHIDNRRQERINAVRRDASVDEYFEALRLLRVQYEALWAKLIGKRHTALTEWIEEEEFRLEFNP